MEEVERGKVCGTYEEKRKTYSVLFGKPDGRSPLGRSRLRWKNNIKIDLQKIVSEVFSVISLAPDKSKWLVVSNRVPSVSMNCRD